MHAKRSLMILNILALVVCPLLPAATTTVDITITGVLSPVLAGSDPLNVNGQTGTIQIKADEGLSPSNHSGSSSQYELPVGAIRVSAGALNYVSTTRSTIIVTLTHEADVLTVVAGSPIVSTLAATIYLAPGSWKNTVLTHPAPFHPSPQNIISATTNGGKGSQVTYLLAGKATVLGLTGVATASQSK